MQMLHSPSESVHTVASDAAGTSKVTKAKKGTWLDQTKLKQELDRKPLSAHQQRQLAHTAAGQCLPSQARDHGVLLMYHVMHCNSCRSQCLHVLPAGLLCCRSQHANHAEVSLFSACAWQVGRLCAFLLDTSSMKATQMLSSDPY